MQVGVKVHEIMDASRFLRILASPANLVLVHLITISLTLGLEIILIIVVIIIGRILFGSLGPIDNSTTSAAATINNVVEVNLFHIVVIVGCNSDTCQLRFKLELLGCTWGLPSSPAWEIVC
jgi:hypothetical protein